MGGSGNGGLAAGSRRGGEQATAVGNGRAGDCWLPTRVGMWACGIWLFVGCVRMREREDRVSRLGYGGLTGWAGWYWLEWRVTSGPWALELSGLCSVI